MGKKPTSIVYGLLALTFFLSGTSYAAGNPPTFRDFPATESFSGSPAPADITSHREAGKYRTVLRDGAKSGPNFAGHYTLVTWGCGSECQEFAIIDAKNGRVYFPAAIRFNSFGMVRDETEPFQYKKDSSLLIIAGQPDEKEELGLFYYHWNGRDLKLIFTEKRAFEPPK